MLGVPLSDEDLKEADVLAYTFTQNILQVGEQVGKEMKLCLDLSLCL